MNKGVRLALIHPDAKVLLAWSVTARKAGHEIEGTSIDPNKIIEMEARFEPHAIIVNQDFVLSKITLGGLTVVVPEVHRSPDDVSAFLNVISCLSADRIGRVFRPRTDRRLVFWNHGWPKTGKKLRVPVVDGSSNFRAHVEQQEGFFCLLVTTARDRLGYAREWLEIYKEHFQELRHELAYRTCHTSWTSYAWARDAKHRLCGALCHFLPGIELGFLPAPQAARPDADYVHHLVPSHLMYPLVCVAGCIQINSAVKSALCVSMTQDPVKFSNAQLVAESAREWGVTEFLFNVAESHIKAFDALLNPQNCLEHTHRALGTVFEFWGMEFFNRMQFPDVRRIADNILAGRTFVDNEVEIAPSYRDFLSAMQMESGGSD